MHNIDHIWYVIKNGDYGARRWALRQPEANDDMVDYLISIDEIKVSCFYRSLKEKHFEAIIQNDNLVSEAIRNKEMPEKFLIQLSTKIKNAEQLINILNHRNITTSGFNKIFENDLNYSLNFFRYSDENKNRLFYIIFKKSEISYNAIIYTSNILTHNTMKIFLKDIRVKPYHLDKMINEMINKKQINMNFVNLAIKFSHINDDQLDLIIKNIVILDCFQKWGFSTVGWPEKAMKMFNKYLSVKDILE